MAKILDPADPADAFALQDIAKAQRDAQLPTCACCKRPIRSETSLDMSAFGLSGYVCECCVANHTVFTDEVYGKAYDRE